MYKVYVDGELLYHPNMEEELSLGRAKVKVELNKAGSFDFTIYKTNRNYASLKKKKSIITVYNEDRRLFRGRVLNVKKGFYNQLQVTCEGELAFLLDSTVRPYEFKGSVEELFQFYINSHNAQMDDEARKFKAGRCTVTDPNDYIVRANTGVNGYPKTLDEMKEKLVEKLGGYLWTREEPDGIYIDYLEDFETMNSQTVEFAKNLLDFEETIKGQDIVTAIIPLGAKLKDENGEEVDERLTISSVNDGVDYVYSPEAVEKYGYIFETVTWDEVTLPENLLRKGKEELQNHINLTRTIELQAVDLHNMNLDIQSFGLGNYTKVISKPHDFNEMLLTRKLDINLLDPSDGSLTLGDERVTFVDKQVETSNKINQTIKTVEKITSDFAVNKEIIDKRIDGVEKKLVLELNSNFGMYQKISGSYVRPDYTVTPLVIVPTVKFKGAEINNQLQFIWKRKVGDREGNLADGESISNGVLTIQNNLESDTIRYVCYVTYNLSDNEKYVANGYLDFVRVADGEKGDPGANGDSGEDAIMLYIDSSNGTTFKNSDVATIFTVSIYVGGLVIDNSEKLKKVFGEHAHLQWLVKKHGDTEFTEIPMDDPRLNDNGFLFTITAKDIRFKAVFNCELNI